MSIVTAFERIPLKTRLLVGSLYVFVIALITYMGLLESPWMWVLVPAFFFFIDQWHNAIFEDDYCKDILQKIRVQNGVLIVGARRLPAQQVTRVVLHQVSTDRGYISFPFNPKLAVSYRFPIEQLQPLRAYLQNKLPQIDFIEQPFS